MELDLKSKRIYKMISPEAQLWYLHSSRVSQAENSVVVASSVDISNSITRKISNRPSNCQRKN